MALLLCNSGPNQNGDLGKVPLWAWFWKTSIVQQLQRIDKQERAKNRAAIKPLICCTHFLAHNHIAHTTNFDKLVDLEVSCGGEDLRYFLEKAGKNATYTLI